MQWIYGGAWILGDNYEFSLYDGTNLAEKNGVIVVAANYRLDVLGWLALAELGAEDPAGAYGNYGIQDQRFALEWTQRNIAKFGGDPNRVTIFGESAGGFSVCQHIVSPKSNGLFSSAIMQSGDCDGPWLIQDGTDAQAFGSLYADAIGCPETLSAKDRLACLRSKPVKDIMLPYASWFNPNWPKNKTKGRSTDALTTDALTNANNNWAKDAMAGMADNYDHQGAGIDGWVARMTRERQQRQPNGTGAAANDPVSGRWPKPVGPLAPAMAWTAVVDGSVKGLPDVPLRMIKKGQVNRSPTGEKVSVIMGTNNCEGCLFVLFGPIIQPGITIPYDANSISLIEKHMISYHDNWNQTTIAQVEGAYPANRYSSEERRFADMLTDFIFACGTRNAVRALADQGHDVYLYHNEYHSSYWLNPDSLVCKGTNLLGCGVFHGADMPFVWGNWQVPKLLSPKDAHVSAAWQTYWTNMAKYGSPNADGVPAPWPKYTRATDQHLVFDWPVKTGAGLRGPICDFWDTLPRQGPYNDAPAAKPVAAATIAAARR